MTDRIAELLGLDPDVVAAVSAVQDELLPMVHRYRAAWQSARRRAAGLESDMRHYEESVVGALNERNIRDARRAGRAEAQVARIRAFLEDMATWCSPHGVAADYAKRGLDALDGIDPFDAIRAKREEQP